MFNILIIGETKSTQLVDPLFCDENRPEVELKGQIVSTPVPHPSPRSHAGERAHGRALLDTIIV